jgi:MoxR-like ATPase
MADIENIANRIVDNVEKVIVGKHAAVQLTVLGLLCQGHMLIEDVPGVGKTVLAKSLSRSVGCKFQRIQFTPDMLPSDVTGVSVFNQKTREFEFRPGPIHAQIVLVDEINRATPKTQSALLEAMEEKQVTVDGSPIAWNRRLWCWPRKIRSNMRGLFRCPKRSWTGLCCASVWGIQARKTKWKSSTGSSVPTLSTA